MLLPILVLSTTIISGHFWPNKAVVCTGEGDRVCVCVHCIVTVERGQNEVKRKIKCLLVRGSNPPHNLLCVSQVDIIKRA